MSSSIRAWASPASRVSACSRASILSSRCLPGSGAAVTLAATMEWTCRSAAGHHVGHRPVHPRRRAGQPVLGVQPELGRRRHKRARGSGYTHPADPFWPCKTSTVWPYPRTRHPARSARHASAPVITRPSRCATCARARRDTGGVRDRLGPPGQAREAGPGGRKPPAAGALGGADPPYSDSAICRAAPHPVAIRSYRTGVSPRS